MQGRAESERDAGFHLRHHAIGIDRDAAIDRADHAMHAHLALFDRHLGNLGNKAAEGFMHGNSASATDQGLARRPADFFGGKIEHAEMTRMRFQQFAAVVERVLAGTVRKLVDHRFHHEGSMGVADRAPPQHRYAGPRRMQLHTVMRNRLHVRRIRHAFDRGAIDAVPHHHRFHHRAGHDRLPDDDVIPRCRHSLRIQCDARAMQIHRPVIAAADIVLAAPDRFHRQTRRLGDFDRLADEIRCRCCPASEAAAKKHRVDLDLLGRQPGDSGRHHLIEGLELRAGPDLAGIGTDLHRAVQRLHRRMREIGHHVLKIHCLVGFCQGRGNIACGHHRRAFGLRQRAETVAQRDRVERRIRTGVPIDLQGIAAQFCRPVVIRHDGHTTRHLHHLADTSHLQGGAVIQRLDGAAEHRRARHHGSQQTIELHIDAELRTTIDLLRRIQPTRRLADQLPVFLILQRHRGRRRQLGGIVDQCAKTQSLIAGNHLPVLGTAISNGNTPSRRRRLHQHRARGGAGLAITIKFGRCR